MSNLTLRNMDTINFPTFLGNYDRPTHTDQPLCGHDGSKGGIVLTDPLSVLHLIKW